MCISTTFNPKQVPYLYVLPVVLFWGHGSKGWQIAGICS